MDSDEVNTWKTLHKIRPIGPEYMDFQFAKLITYMMETSSRHRKNPFRSIGSAMTDWGWEKLYDQKNNDTVKNQHKIADAMMASYRKK